MSLHCTIYYFPSPHLNQIYEGFNRLQEKGIVNVNYVKENANASRPILNVIINGLKITYDTLDGFNWIEGSEIENLEYFRYHINSDFYFKRSYSPIILDYRPANTKIFPLGLNYNFSPSIKKILPAEERLKSLLAKILYFRRLKSKFLFPFGDFENLPIPNKKSNILFMTRLWNPKDIKSDAEKEKWKILNDMRVECIRRCRENYGDTFFGGLQDDEFSRSIAPDLILPNEITRKRNYINLVRKSNICIASTGLHKSIGWKFGEYVSLSRSIVSEPLHYELPGNFEEGINYLAFKGSDELVQKIDRLLSDKNYMVKMMTKNFDYYTLYLKPETLVLRSLLIVLHESGIEYDC